MNICILKDDNTEELLKLLNKIHLETGMEQEICVYDTLLQLSMHCVIRTAHVVIMNEKLGDFTGYEAAYRLRVLSKNIMPIIIISKKEDKIDAKAGEAEIFGCITWKDMEQELPKLLGYADKREGVQNSYSLCYRWNNQEKSIDFNNVIYLHSRHRVIEIMGKNGVEGVFYQKLDEVEEELKKQGIEFVRSSKSFLVNPKHIIEKNEQEVILDSGERLHITRKYSKNVAK